MSEYDALRHRGDVATISDADTPIPEEPDLSRDDDHSSSSSRVVDGAANGDAFLLSSSSTAFYCPRLLLVFLPLLAFLIVTAGESVVITLVVAAASVYIADSTGVVEASISVIWTAALAVVAVVCVQGDFRSRSTFFTVFLMLNTAWTIVCGACYVCLSRGDVVREYPKLARTLQLTLHTVLPLPAASTLTCSMLLSSGVRNISFYFAVLLYLAVRVCVAPLPRSLFANDTGKAKFIGKTLPGSYTPLLVVPTGVTQIYTAFVVMLPAALHISTNVQSAEVSTIALMADIGLLVSLCVLLVLLPARTPTATQLGFPVFDGRGPQRRGGAKREGVASVSKAQYVELSRAVAQLQRFHPLLWWFPRPSGGQKQFHAYRFRLAAFLLLAAIPAFEVRIHDAFAPYLALQRFSPILAHAVLDVCFVSLFAVVMLVVWGRVYERAARGGGNTAALAVLLLHVCCQVGAVAGMLTIGLPLLLFPAGCIGAYAFARVVLKREVSVFLVVLCCFAAVVAAFVYRQYFFLTIEISSHVFKQTGSISIRHLSVLLGLLAVLAVGAAGFVVLVNRSVVAGVLIAVHAWGLMLAETLLVRLNGEYEYTVYPFYLVLGTSGLGVAVMRHLLQTGRVAPVWAWAGVCMYVGKLCLLLEASDEYFMLSAVAMLLVVTSVQVLFGSVSELDAATGVLIDTHRPMAMQDCVVYASVVGAVLFGSHSHLFPVVLDVLGVQTENAMVTVSLFVLSWCASMLPVTFSHLHEYPGLRRANTLLLVVSCVFLFIFSVDLGAVNVWELQNNSSSSSSSSSSYSAWFLSLAIVAAVIGFTTAVALPQFLMGGVFGGLLGAFYCATFVPYNFVVCVVFTLITCVMCVLLAYHVFPTPRSTTLMRFLFAVFCAMLPLAVSVQRTAFGSGYYSTTQTGLSSESYATQMKLRLEGSAVALYSLYGMLCFLAALVLNAVPAARLRPARGLKARIQKQQHRHSSSSRGVLGVQDFTSAVIGNLCCVCALMFALTVHLGYMQGSEAGVLVLSPVLLLLRPDGQLLPVSLAASFRYHLVYWAVVVLLLLSITLDLYIRPFVWGAAQYYVEESVVLWHIFSSSTDVVEGGELRWSVGLMIKESLLTILALPGAYLFGKHAWNGRGAGRDFNALVLVLPIHVLPCFFADLLAVQLVAACSLCGTIVQMMDVTKTSKMARQVL